MSETDTFLWYFRLSNSFHVKIWLFWKPLLTDFPLRWAQSFLVGIPKVICGFRDDDGIVLKLEDYPIKLLPKMGKNWLPHVCMNFLNKILSYIHQLINPLPPTTDGKAPDLENNELVMYNFSWDPKNNDNRIRVVKQKFAAQNVLPSWYTSKVFSD